MVDIMDLPTEEADEATVHVDVGRKLPEPTPEKMPESVVETNSDTAEMAPSSSVAKRKAKSTASSGNEARLKLKESQHKCPYCDKKMSVHALLYTHPKNCAGVPLSVRLAKFRGLSPPDATETEQSTHEKPEVDTAVTDRASPLSLHTHPTRKGPEETDGKRVLYMKLVANAF